MATAVSTPPPDTTPKAPLTSSRDHVTRAEGWRRRGPLLPALIFLIVVTQIPFVFTLYYSTQSWNLVRPDSRAFVGLDNYVAVFGDSQFWRVTVNTILLIVGTVLITLAACIISIPIGVLTAIYLVEYGNKGPLARGLTFFVDVMTGIPSIVAGLFAFALFSIFFARVGW